MIGNNISIIKKEQCCGCHACYNSCPKNAIEMVADSEGFLYPQISENKCVNCGKCVQSCPEIKPLVLNPLEKSYACYAKEEEEHMSSSSGGFFAVLARQILKEGGVVCGAAFDELVRVNHIITDNESDLIKIKKTKYVQSTIGKVYSHIEQLLQRRRNVLFSGTPCQVAGLKMYLGKEYENLICLDLICHGVPSPKVFSRYLMEKGGNHKVTAMSFRNKQKGISNVTLDYWLDNGEKISETYEESLFIKGFIQNLYVRPSCYTCKFKGIKRSSDITIGDFLGIDEFHPGFSNHKGISAVILHSEKALQLFEKIMGALNYVSATSKEIGAWNSCLYHPVKENKNREVFFERWENKSVSECIRELQDCNYGIASDNSIKAQIYKKLKRFLCRD